MAAEVVRAAHPTVGERILRAMPGPVAARIVAAMPAEHAGRWRALLQRRPARGGASCARTCGRAAATDPRTRGHEARRRRPARRAAGRRRARAAGRAVRRRPGRHHHLLGARRRPRLPIAVGAAAVHGRADGLPQPGRADGRGHRAGPDRTGAPALRRAGRRCGAGRTRGGQHRHDLRRIRRYRSGFRAVRHQPLHQRAGRRGDRVAAGATGQLPAGRAVTAAAVDGVPGLHRLGVHGQTRLGCRTARHPGADDADDGSGHRDRHRHPGHHAGAVGAVVHAVLCGGQETADRGLGAGTDRRDHRSRAHRGDRLLRRGGLRGHPAPRRAQHHRRGRRGGRPAATGR